MIMKTGNKRVLAIVQARMGASRLPNKMMMWLHGYPIIEWVRQRVGKIEGVGDVVFALPDTHLDNVLAIFLEKKEEKIFRGDEADVLGRFRGAAMANNATHVVRICADNPFISSRAIDDLIDFYFSNNCDYAYNHIPVKNTYPDGLGAEIVSMKILEALHIKAKKEEEREHIFNYIWNNPKDFSIKTLNPLNDAISFPDVKLDIDTIGDYLKFISLPLSMEMEAEDIVRIYRKYS